MTYLQELRIQRAKMLLLESRLNISQIETDGIFFHSPILTAF